MQLTKKILIGIIAVSLLVSCYTAFNRYKAEERNNHIEIAIDMTEFQDLAGEMGMSFEDVTQRLKYSGATSIGVQETTLKDLKERGYIAYMSLGDFMMGSYSTGTVMPLTSELQARYRKDIEKRINSKGINNRIFNYNMIIITPYKDVFDFLQSSFSDRIKIETIREGNQYAIITSQKLKNMEESGLGFFDRDLEYAKTLGFINVIPRIQNFQGITRKQIDKKILQVKKINAKTVIFAGESVLGYNADEEEYKELINYAAQEFKKNGLIAAIIEKPADDDINKGQRGIKIFSRESEYASSKVFSVEYDKQKRLKPKDYLDQWSRAIAERNVRIIYVKPIWNPEKEPIQVLKDTSEAVSQISKRVTAMGLHRKAVVGLNDIEPSCFERLVIIIGIIAGSLLLLLAFFNMSEYITYGLLVIGSLGTAALLYSTVLFNIFGDLGIKMAALLCAIVFPSLASWHLISYYKNYFSMEEKPGIGKIIMKNILVLIKAAIIAAAGGIMIAALLAESKYMLKLDIFRGVKIAFVSPMIIFLLLYIKYIGLYSDKDGNPISISLQLKKIFNTSVTIKYAVAGLIVLTAVAVLLMRSGNAPATMSSDIELRFRAILENIFIARPRSKELISFPLLMLLIYSYVNRNKTLAFLSLFAGVVGLADIVNSFSHIRMSLLMAVLSTSYSVFFGIMFGAVLIIILNVINNRYFKNTGIRGEIH
ncbi:MAG: DUF5693 family protein [Deltaproteobacteria bacterium]